MATLKERLEAAAATSAERIKALDEAEQAEAAPEKPKPKPKPAEKRGTGAPSFDLEGAIAKLKARIARLNGENPEQEAKLLARIAALKANQ